jgi:hypothetical protein
MPKNFKLLKVQSPKFKELIAFSFLGYVDNKGIEPFFFSGASLIFLVSSLMFNV